MNYVCFVAGTTSRYTVDMSLGFFSAYHMMVVNVVVLMAVLIAGYFLMVRRKVRVPGWVLVLVVSLMPLVSVLRAGTYESGDLSINAVKLMSFYQNLKEGVLIPRWAGELNATYGYPSFLFAYPLPYYLGSGFHWLGFSFIDSIKAVLILTFVVSGLLMYGWLTTWLSKRAAVVGAILYLFAPYHLVNLEFRVDIGELTAMMWLPLLLMAGERWIKDRKADWLWGLAGSVAGLVLSHQAVTLIGLPVVGMYGLWRLRQMKQLWWQGIVAVIMGLGLSAWYWLPVLYEGRFTHQADMARQVVFAETHLYLWTPWRWGLLFQGHQGELSFPVGYVQLLLMGWLGWQLWRKKRVEKRLNAWFWIGVLFGLFVLMQKISGPVWQVLPLLRQLQFASRIMAVVSLVAAVVGAIAVNQIRQKRWLVLIGVAAMASTILNWGNRRMLPEITDKVLAAGLPLSTVSGEGLGPAAPKWVPRDRIWQAAVPGRHLEIIGGEAAVTEIERKTTTHLYQVQTMSGAVLKDNTTYFPGWEVWVDGKPTAIDYQSENYPGVMTFVVPAGEHRVEVRFARTSDRVLAEDISLLVVTGWLGWGAWLVVRRNKITAFRGFAARWGWGRWKRRR